MRYAHLTVTGTEWLNANDRRHWGARARLVEQWRNRAAWAALAAHLPAFDGRVYLTAVLLFGDERRRDPANWYPTVKACVDGLVDAKVLPDDDASHVVGPDMRARVRRGLVVPTVELHLRQFDGADELAAEGAR